MLLCIPETADAGVDVHNGRHAQLVAWTEGSAVEGKHQVVAVLRMLGKIDDGGDDVVA
jgi:hypothetical protein